MAMKTGYRPTALTFNGPGGQPYNAADIPIPNYMVSPGIDRTILEQQFAYEWFDVSGPYSSGHNPPFTGGAAGRLLPEFTSDGQPRRILRGFIRRSDYDLADTKSTARLYFMYNPEQITRDYVSYLDQGALDPFNSVFQSGNLVPPPSFMDFSFSLLFDRQEETAKDGNHPGVFVDYEYFDLVVRNVLPNYEPGGTSRGGSELPDNGVMMVNPRDITVVFSPNITVQGRPKEARVQFTKFTHRMIPIRMQVDLTMRVTYFGPMKDMVEYKAEETVVEDSVPWNVGTESPFHITNDEIQENAKAFLAQMTAKAKAAGGDFDLFTDEGIDKIIDGLVKNGTLPEGIRQISDTNIAASGDLAASIADWGFQMTTAHNTIYSAGQRANLWNNADCSSWVWAVFATHPSKPNVTMGSTWASSFESKKNIPATDGMIASMTSAPVQPVFQSRAGSASERAKVILPNCALMLPGDLLFRKAGVVKEKGHVAIVYSNNIAGKTIEIVDCYSPGKPAGKRSLTYAFVSTDYTECYRPMLGNADTPGNRPMAGNNSGDMVLV